MKNTSGTLTKAFLFSLETGKYLASNCMFAPGQPVFAEQVKDVEGREAQWKRIVQKRANGRLSYVFDTAGDFQKWCLEIPFRREKN
ncbi:MAG: hypothetical protein JWM16_4205 [Verrucomicrobiales bacterium]|nr:hypothetical protein [Verrucomicrobiales bacterium]